MQSITQTSRSLAILLVVASLCFASCKSPEDRIQDFVKSYNRGADKLSNTIVGSTSAYFISKDDVGLKFTTNNAVDSTDTDLYLNLLPDLIANLLSTTPAAQQLIHEGVTFNISFLDKNNSTVRKIRVDEQKLSELLAKSKEKQTANSKAGDLSHLSEDTKQMLTLLNANLPYEDVGTGIKILQVSVIHPQELTYTVEVPLDLVPIIKGEEAKEMLRNEIVNSENFRTVITTMEGLNLIYVRYLYVGPSGEVVNEFKLTKEDLLPNKL
jgi:hypothetical protein